MIWSSSISSIALFRSASLPDKAGFPFPLSRFLFPLRGRPGGGLLLSPDGACQGKSLIYNVRIVSGSKSQSIFAYRGKLL